MKQPDFIEKIRNGLLRITNELLPGTNQVRSKEYWADLANHGSSWNDRTELLADFIIPADRSVFEFGAGQLALKKFLPSEIQYFNHDLEARDENTVVFDLNVRPLPVEPAADVAVFSGVLEYITDLPDFLSWLTPRFRSVAASYVVREKGGPLKHRYEMGWQNHLRGAELKELFQANGYSLVRQGSYSANQELYRWEQH